MQPVRLAAAVSLAALLGGWSLQENVVARAATRAGVVTVVQVDEPPAHVVRLAGGTRLYRAPTYGVEGAGLAIARVFARTAPDEDLVVLSQSDGGTECRAEYVLVAVRRGRPASVSAPFGNCATPAFAREGQRLRITFPRAGDADPEVGVYAAGRLTRLGQGGG